MHAATSYYKAKKKTAGKEVFGVGHLPSSEYASSECSRNQQEPTFEAGALKNV